MAQLDYCYKVCQYDCQGIPFRTYLYVPEIHPDTGMPFSEREDEAHLLKVIQMCIDISQDYMFRFDTKVEGFYPVCLLLENC